MSRFALTAATRVGFESLRANPLRTSLSMLGVIMGSASLAAVLSIGDGAEQFARRRIEREGVQVVAVVPRTADTVDGLRVPRIDYPVFGQADAEGLQGRLGASARVTLVLEGTGLAYPAGAASPRGVLVTATTATGLEVLGLAYSAGRGFAAQESGAHAVVLSRALAVALGESGRPVAVGETVRVGQADWTVVGVTAEPEDERGLAAWVPLGLADRALVPSATPRAPSLRVHAERAEDVRDVRDRLKAWVGSHGRDWADRVVVAATGEERLRQVAQGIAVFKILMGAITAISLVVGGIGIMNVLLASVAERTREIGVRKAVGATRRGIVMQFLAESIAICGLGSVMGVALGLAGAHAVTAIARARTQALVFAGVTWQSIAVSALTAVAVGLVFGLYPALKASRLAPIDALRYE